MEVRKKNVKCQYLSKFGNDCYVCMWLTRPVLPDLKICQLCRFNDKRSREDVKR